MEYSYLNLGHLSSILKIERGSNPYPWSELNFKDCLEQGYYSLALEDQTELVGFAIMAISTDCLLYTSPSPRDRVLSRMPSSA